MLSQRVPATWQQRQGTMQRAAPSKRPRVAVVRSAPTTARSSNRSSGSTTGTVAGSKAAVLDMKERMEWLKGDLVHLFDDQGVDPNG